MNLWIFDASLTNVASSNQFSQHEKHCKQSILVKQNQICMQAATARTEIPCTKVQFKVSRLTATWLISWSDMLVFAANITPDEHLCDAAYCQLAVSERASWLRGCFGNLILRNSLHRMLMSLSTHLELCLPMCSCIGNAKPTAAPGIIPSQRQRQEKERACSFTQLL